MGILRSSFQLICRIEADLHSLSHLHTKNEEEGDRNWNIYDNNF